jgi:2,4-dienoyl-CoA reductase-like NADH-dependent reductase (Old Yellow Enzyme family)
MLHGTPIVFGVDDVAGQLRKRFKGNILSAGGFDPIGAEAIVEEGDADMVAFGRLIHFESRFA